MPPGPRFLVLFYALTFPLVLAGRVPALNPVGIVYQWLGLDPVSIWDGQVWRLVTYAFFPAGIVDWAVSLFWLVTLAMVLGRSFSSSGFLAYCLMCAAAGGLPLVCIFPGASIGIVTCVPLIFGLLVAWERLYGRERILMLGIGEVSVRHAAIVVGVINVAVIVFCAGLLVTSSLLCGGVAGFLYFTLGRRNVMKGRSRVVDSSERMARLEL